MVGSKQRGFGSPFRSFPIGSLDTDPVLSGQDACHGLLSRIVDRYGPGDQALVRTLSRDRRSNTGRLSPSRGPPARDRDLPLGDACRNSITWASAAGPEAPLPMPLKGRDRIHRRWPSGSSMRGRCTFSRALFGPDQSVYALDSTTIALACRSFRRRTSAGRAVKDATRARPRGHIPSFIQSRMARCFGRPSICLGRARHWQLRRAQNATSTLRLYVITKPGPSSSTRQVADAHRVYSAPTDQRTDICARPFPGRLLASGLDNAAHLSDLEPADAGLRQSTLDFSKAGATICALLQKESGR